MLIIAHGPHISYTVRIDWSTDIITFLLKFCYRSPNANFENGNSKFLNHSSVFKVELDMLNWLVDSNFFCRALIKMSYTLKITGQIISNKSY